MSDACPSTQTCTCSQCCIGSPPLHCYKEENRVQVNEVSPAGTCTCGCPKCVAGIHCRNQSNGCR